MAVKIQIRNGLASEWAAANPILAVGELAIESDTKKFKIGDGITSWSSLTYATQGEPGTMGPEGPGLEYTWNGTSLGVRKEGETVYTYTNLVGSQGPQGIPGVDGATYTHPTTAGNKHIPTGGTVGQILKNTASGTATWQAESGGSSVTVEDVLTSTSAVNALSANQGKVLSDLVSTKSTKTSYTATLPSASWTGSASPYSKAVTVTGILATDTPLIDIVPSGTYATDVTMETNWAQIYRMVTSANTVTFYAHSVPTADIPLQILVVR